LYNLGSKKRKRDHGRFLKEGKKKKKSARESNEKERPAASGLCKEICPLGGSTSKSAALSTHTTSNSENSTPKKNLNIRDKKTTERKSKYCQNRKKGIKKNKK